ncbi:MAG: hypothetical protein KAS23_07465 [Anaerohalosphaera sp.]|nr:hypothetical protein [Anaerohalosphaera sp.]
MEIILKTLAIIVLASAALGFVGISFMDRIRFGLSLAIGIAILGFVGLALLKHPIPLTGITFYHGGITIADTAICAALAFAASFIAYFAAYPAGPEMAPLAAPAGLAYIVFRSGDMLSLINLNSTAIQRQDLYSALKLEGFYFLLIIAAGLLGVIVAMKLTGKQLQLSPQPKLHKFKFNKGLSIAIAIVAAAVIAQFTIGILAQDVRYRDIELGTVIGQVHTGQIAFAVIVGFAIAAFAVEYLLAVSYIPVVFAAAVLSFYSLKFYANPGVLEHMAKNWPAAFFPRAICSILPIQMVTFAAIGAVLGNIAAVKFRQNENADKKNDN